MTAIWILTGLGYALAAGMAAFLFSQRKKQMADVDRLRALLAESEKLAVEKTTELKILKETLENERQWMRSVEGQLRDTFQSLAASTLEGTQNRFLQLANTSFEKKNLELDSLIKPLQESLQRYQSQTHNMEMERQRSFATIENEIKKIVETGHALSKETMALKDALKKPHVRGRWGEVQLKNCVELAGMSDFADVTFQDAMEKEGKRYIPDMTVRMPGDRLVIVDSKTPVDAFLSSLEASTEEERNAEMLRHGKHVRTHVMQLAEKGYAQEFKNSADFTVMFLPNESFLYAALETQPDLVDFALSKKILIATPPTLVGLLKVIRYGWNEKRLAKNAQEIAEVGKELHKRIVDFLESYDEIGQRIEQAQKAFETGRMRLQSRIAGKARQLEELGAKGSKDIPELTGV